MKTIGIIDPVNDSRWDRFVINHKYGSLFHSTAWCEVLKKTFSYQPSYLVLEEDGKITAGIPFMIIDSWITGKRLISLPRTSYCDPLAENEADLNALIEQACSLAERLHMDFFEIKTQKNEALLTNTRLTRYGYFINQILDLDDGPEKLWGRFHRSCIRQRVARARKDNVTVRVAVSDQDLKSFYELHKETTRIQMTPPRPYSFFKNIWDAFRPNNSVFILVAELEKKTAAAGFFLRDRNSIIFEFIGLNYDFIDHSPGHLIAWEAIQMACREGCRYFDFGLTPPENVGLMQYKERWGTRTNMLNYYYYPDVKGYKKFIKKTARSRGWGAGAVLKEKTKRFIATRLYKHLG